MKRKCFHSFTNRCALILEAAQVLSLRLPLNGPMMNHQRYSISYSYQPTTQEHCRRLLQQSALVSQSMSHGSSAQKTRDYPPENNLNWLASQTISDVQHIDSCCGFTATADSIYFRVRYCSQILAADSILGCISHLARQTSDVVHSLDGSTEDLE
jgi:hypothetical protein